MASITIPDSVISIGANAFTGSNITCINWNPAISRTVDALAFPTSSICTASPTPNPSPRPSLQPTMQPTIDLKTACKPGFYLTGIINNNIPLCESCLSGTYSQDSFCVQCPLGKISGSTASSCSNCPNGTITLSPGSSGCHFCPVIPLSTSHIIIVTIIIQVGKYSNTNHTLCMTCTNGRISQAGSYSCEELLCSP